MHICVCVGRVAAQWGGMEEVEKSVSEESGVGEPAKDEVGLAASFPLPSQHFTTKKLCSGQFNHGKTHFPEEERGVCGKVWVLLFSTPWLASPVFSCSAALRNKLHWGSQRRHYKFLTFWVCIREFYHRQPSQEFLGKNEIIFRNLLMNRKTTERSESGTFSKSSRSDCTDL